MNVAREIIYKYNGISLREMDAVKLMNRTDRKYWFHRDMLAAILESVIQDYYILEVDGERDLPYSTTYYDTSQDSMYNNHHRGKLNRYKIRRRNYISTQSSFLEVKFKNNKGRTIKVRRASDYKSVGFNAEEAEFIAQKSPYSTDELRAVFKNEFKRLMLVSKGMNERCTIDSELKFMSGAEEVALNNMVIVEVKSDGRSHSAIIEALNRWRIKPSGFSKYCIGRSLTERSLPRNNFKRRHRDIDKRFNLNNYGVD